MTVYSFPFDDQDTSETDFSFLFRELQDTGVIGSFGDSSLAVYADSSGMFSKVPAGSAIVRGFMLRSDAEVVLTHDDADASPRIDTVVLRLDPAANAITVEIVKGTPAATPSAPSLTQTDEGVFEFPLADVPVAAGAVTLSTVTDRRRWAGHRVGVWATGTRPASPRKGRLGLNTASGTFEFWDGSAWVDLTPSALDASVITSGTLSTARIPTLDASKIGTGTLSIDRVPTIPWSKLSSIPSTFPPSSHSHAAGDLTSGTVSLSRGGTGASTAAGARANLGIPEIASADPTGSTLVQRLSDGRIKIADPTFDTDGATRGYVESRVDALLSKIAQDGGNAHADGVTDAAYARSVGSSYYSVYMDGNRDLGRNVSSIRYKAEVKAAIEDGLGDADLLEVVLALEPKTYVRKSDPKRHRDLGLIAEEVEKIAPFLVVHDQERDPATGEVLDPDAPTVPETVAYETTLVVTLVGALKAAVARIEDLEHRLDDLGA